MKTKTIAFATVLVPASLCAQTIIGSSAFFDPDFKVRRNGDGGTVGSVLAAVVTNSPVSGTGSTATNFWDNSAGGFAQTRVTVPGVVAADVQLAAYTQLTGDSLVFGREFTSTATALGVVPIGNTVQGIVNNVVGASVIYNWGATAEIGGLTIVPDQLYQVNFRVDSGAGLPVDVLDSSTFSITTPGVTGASNESTQLIDLLGLLSIGSGSSTGDFAVTFKSSAATDKLNFAFAASTDVGVSALGGTAGNQNVLTFSGFSVNQIPEPSSSLLCGLAGFVLLGRRRR